MENAIENDPRLNPATVWYGPHGCEECGALVVKASREQGGAAFDPPAHLLRVFARGAESGNVDVAYPAVWVPHVHRTENLPPKA